MCDDSHILILDIGIKYLSLFCVWAQGRLQSLVLAFSSSGEGRGGQASQVVPWSVMLTFIDYS